MRVCFRFPFSIISLILPASCIILGFNFFCVLFNCLLGGRAHDGHGSSSAGSLSGDGPHASVVAGAVRYQLSFDARRGKKLNLCVIISATAVEVVLRTYFFFFVFFFSVCCCFAAIDMHVFLSSVDILSSACLSTDVLRSAGSSFPFPSCQGFLFAVSNDQTSFFLLLTMLFCASFPHGLSFEQTD